MTLNKKLFVDRRGAGEPIFLIHGLGGTADIWQSQVEKLEENYTIVRMDLDGSGRSGVSDKLSIDGWVDDIVAVLESLDLTKAHFVGHSLGTLILQHLAVKHPSKVLSLALLGVTQAPPPQRHTAIQERAATVRQKGMAEICDAIIAGGLSPETRANKSEVVRSVRGLLMTQPSEGYARSCEALVNSSSAEISALKCPITLLCGNDDAVSPSAAADAFITKVAHAERILLEKCGHWHSLEQPEAVTEALQSFLQRITKKS